MSEQFVRLAQIILYLPKYPKFITANQLQKKYIDEGFKNIYPEKVQRDIKTLTQILDHHIGCESYSDWSKRTGHKLTDDQSQHVFWESTVQPIMLDSLTVQQALSLHLLKKFLLPLIPNSTYTILEPFFDEAAHKLEILKDENRLSHWPNKIAIVNPTQPLLMPTIDLHVHETVSEALLYDRQLKIKYRRINGSTNEYHLNPIGLVLRSATIYLIASKVDTKEKRIFALHRISEATQLDQKVEGPNDCELQQFIDQGHMGFDLTGGGNYQMIKLKAVFDQITANHLSESRLSEDQEIKKLDDQHYEITATIQETEQLFWWLLSFGFRVEVLEPPALRAKMAYSVRILAEKYKIYDIPE